MYECKIYIGGKPSVFDLDYYRFANVDGIPTLYNSRSSSLVNSYIIDPIYNHCKSIEELKLFCDMRGDTVTKVKQKLGSAKVHVIDQILKSKTTYQFKIINLDNYSIDTCSRPHGRVGLEKICGRGKFYYILHSKYDNCKSLQDIKKLSEECNG